MDKNEATLDLLYKLPYSAEQPLMSMFSASSECQSNSSLARRYHLCICTVDGMYSEYGLRKAT